MMRFLIADIGPYFFKIRRANSKSPISLLPGKIGTLFSVYPTGRACLQFSHEIIKTVRSGKPHKQMNVIFDPADCQARATLILHDPGKIIEKICTPTIIDRRCAILCTKHQMKVNARVGRRHNVKPPGNASGISAIVRFKGGYSKFRTKIYQYQIHTRSEIKNMLVLLMLSIPANRMQTPRMFVLELRTYRHIAMPGVAYRWRVCPRSRRSRSANRRGPTQTIFRDSVPMENSGEI